MGNILSYLNPFSENFLGYKLIELLGNLLKTLFIPSTERLTAITDTVKSKFGFIDTVSNLIDNINNSINSLDSSPEFTYYVDSKYYTGNLSIINLSWYAPFKPFGDLIITGFAYLLFLWRLFIHIPNIIHGTAGEYVDVLAIQERRFKK